MYFRLTPDPKSGNWRVYLNDDEVCQPDPVRTRRSGVGDRSSTVDSDGSGPLSSVLKNKTQACTSEFPHRVCDMTVVIMVALCNRADHYIFAL